MDSITNRTPVESTPVFTGALQLSGLSLRTNSVDYLDGIWPVKLLTAVTLISRSDQGDDRPQRKQTQ